MVRYALSPVVLLVASVLAQADVVTDAVDDVLAACAAEDAKALEAAARRPRYGPGWASPWIVAEELILRGETDAAIAFARATEGKANVALPGYVTGRRVAEGEDRWRAALLRSKTLRTEGKKPEEILAALEGVPAEAVTVLSVRLRTARAMCLRDAGRFRESGQAFAASASMARSLGWLVRARISYVEGAQQSDRARDAENTHRWVEEALRIPRDLGDPAGLASALAGRGLLLSRRGEIGEAEALQAEALSLIEPLVKTNRKAAEVHAAVLSQLARTYAMQERLDLAVSTQERAAAALEALDSRLHLAYSLSNLGATEWLRGNAAAALPHLRRARAMMKELGVPTGEAFVLVWLARALFTLGESEESRTGLEEALRLGRAMKIGWVEASALRGLGGLAMESGPLSEALAHQVRAREVFRTLPDRSEEVWLLIDMSLVLSRLGRSDEAERVLAEAVDLAERKGQRMGLSFALNRLGQFHTHRGEYEKALVVLERALGRAEVARYRYGRACALGSIGVVHWRLGRFAEAFEALEKARVIFTEIGNLGEAAGALHNLALVHRSVGNYGRAAEALRRTMRAERDTGNRVGLANTLNNLGLVLGALGEEARSLTRKEEALALARDVGDLDVTAEILTSLASSYLVTGERDRARSCLEEALRLRRRLGDRMGTATSLYSLGQLLVDGDEFAAAKEAWEEALTIWEEAGNREGAAGTRAAVAMSLRLQGEHEAARRTYREALARQEDIGDRRGAAGCRQGLALLEETAGRFDVAADLYREVLEEAEGMGVSGLQLAALDGLADCMFALKRPEEALTASRRAVDRLSMLVSGFGEEEGAAARSGLAITYRPHDPGARAAAALDRPGDLCFFLESGRAGGLLESLGGRARMRAVAIPPEVRQEEMEARGEEIGAGHRLRAAIEKGNVEAIRKARRELGAAQERVRRAVERVRRESKLAASLVYPVLDGLAEIRSRLRPGEALVLYGLYEKEALALVATPDRARIARLGDPSPITAAASRVARAGQRGAGGWRRTGETTATDAGLARLVQLVVEPLEIGEEIRRVLVSPDGVLSAVPFCLLLPDREVVHVPSGTVLGTLWPDREARGRGVLALGHPVYGSHAVAATRAVRRVGERLDDLPGTADEAKAVGDVVLLRERATETALRQALGRRKRWRSVHFACHGLLDPERATHSSLALTPDAESDGYLTCLEVFRLEIPADLVVLSACETARGKIYEAEGVMGLTRAFQLAGAPRVIVSLWKVDDEATRALMERFYELWNPKDGSKGMPTATALKKAQEHVRSHEMWKHPYYWAAWQLWGLPD